MLTFVPYAVQPTFGESMVDSQLLFNWNNVFWGATTMLAKITNQGAYHQLVPKPYPLHTHTIKCRPAIPCDILHRPCRR